MAIKKQPSVYGVVETNHVAAVKTGQHYTQYELDKVDFADTPAENGMLLVVDHVEGKIKKPKDESSYVGLHTSVEKDYENKGRKYFCVKPGQFNPRINKLNLGDLFETQCFQYDTAVYADYSAIKSAISESVINKANYVYGVPSTSGYIDVKAASTPTATVELKAVKAVVLPNGEDGIKWEVVKA